MQPEGSLPHSQMSATCPYPEPARFIPYLHIPLHEDSSENPHNYALVSQVVSFPQGLPPKPCIRLASHPRALHAPPISFFSILSPEQYWYRSFIQKNSTRCNNVSKLYYSMFIWSSTCFGRHTAQHQEAKTALAASGFPYVEGCWTCSRWTLSGKLPDNVHQLHVPTTFHV